LFPPVYKPIVFKELPYRSKFLGQLDQVTPPSTPNCPDPRSKFFGQCRSGLQASKGFNILFLDQGSVFGYIRGPNFGFCFYLIIRVYFPDQAFKSYGAKGLGKTLLRWIFAYGNFIEQDGWYTINIGIVYISYTAKSFSAITRCLKAVNRFIVSDQI
jgi:hypothetical protein